LGEWERFTGADGDCRVGIACVENERWVGTGRFKGKEVLVEEGMSSSGSRGEGGARGLDQFINKLSNVGA
jgi:hypothetical protein